VQPVTVNAADVSMWVSRLWWPALRVGGFVLAAPIASETTIPGLVKIVMSLSLAFLMAPLVQVPAALSIFSAAGLLAAVQEVLIGVAIGMVVQLTFEALTFAGQSISLTMGLGFATLVDPQRGAVVHAQAEDVHVAARPGADGLGEERQPDPHQLAALALLGLLAAELLVAGDLERAAHLLRWNAFEQPPLHANSLTDARRSRAGRRTAGSRRSPARSRSSPTSRSWPSAWPRP